MQTLSLLIAAVAASAASATPSSQGVLLEFSATWCGPCQQISPLVRRLERQGFPIRKVDVDRDAALARRFHIRSIPAFVLMVNGKEVARRVGPQSESELKRLMALIPKSVPQPKTVAVSARNRQRRGPPSSSHGSTSNIAAAAASAKSILPRFRFPLFGAKRKVKSGEAAAATDVTPIIRAKYDSRRQGNENVVRFDPLASSTRIRVKDNAGVNFGSGTIIHSAAGRTVVLTCGHIFRDLKPESLIEVDVYDGKQPETYVGKVLDYDLKADVGLVLIASDLPLPASKIAAVDDHVSPHDSVFSIGCGGGEPPSRQQIKVTALNRYLGPDNVECTGVPDQGRSGGSLFNSDGKIIGVCIAADPQDQRGLYAGLQPIFDLLNRAGLAHLYRPDNDASRLRQAADDRPILAAGENNNVVPASAVVAAHASRSVTTVPEGSEEAEVICIIRTLNDPRSASHVVIINRASPKFLSYLRGELQQQPQPTTTQTFNPDKRQSAQFPATPQTTNKPRSEIASQLQPSWRPAETARPHAEKFIIPSAPRRYRRSAASRK